LLWRRHYEEPEIGRIVGIPEASSFEIAFLAIPGSDTEIELLQYNGIEQVSGAVPPSRHGSGHFCLFVDDIDMLYAALATRGGRCRSDGPVELTAGADRRGKSLHPHDPCAYET